MFSVGTKVRFSKLRTVGAIALLGALSFGGVVAAQGAAAANDPNYIPNGCKQAGKTTYTSYTNGIQPCNKWPAWNASHGGSTAPSAGVVQEADTTYMPNGCKTGKPFYTSYNNGTQPCNKWPAFNARFGGAAPATTAAPVATAPAPAPAAAPRPAPAATAPTAAQLCGFNATCVTNRNNLAARPQASAPAAPTASQAIACANRPSSATCPRPPAQPRTASNGYKVRAA